MERLHEKYGPWLKKRIFKNIEKHLQKERQQLTHSKRPVLIRIRARLELLYETYEPFGFTDISELYDGIKNTYESSRKALKELESHLDAEAYHELRKRTKDLQNQLEFFPDEIVKPIEEELKIITTFLGNDQDLYLLEESLEEDLLKSGAGDLLEALIKNEHDHLKDTALNQAREVFEKSSRKFIHNLTKRRNIMENTEDQIE
jgi:CHAD domain-containing protein